MKKIVYRYLSGFAFGALMLVLSYLLLYTIGGNGCYSAGISTIISPSALFLQLVWSGIVYVFINITLINTHEFLKKEENDITLPFLIMYMVHLIIIICSTIFAQRFGRFSREVYSLVYGIGIIIIILGTIADMIQNAIKFHNLKKNKKNA
jgi:hypothetical protein